MTDYQGPNPVKMVVAGLLAVAAFLAGITFWAVKAPLSSAAIAQGVVVVESSRKVIQHLEGGLIDNIPVKEGDRVQAGDTLLSLDVTQAKASLELLRARLDDALASEARLVAERDDMAKIDYPGELVQRSDDPKVMKILLAQENIFSAGKKALSSQVDIISQRNAQSREEITGLEAQITSQKLQIALLDEEIEDVRGLIEKGLAKKPRLLQLRRLQAEINGAMGRNISAIARVRQRIGENQLTVTMLSTRRVNDAVSELKQVQASIYDLREQIRSSEFVLRRTTIVAPISGTIVNLQVHTSGGVIGPGEKLMDIVPSRDRLIVDARIDPKDIDAVQVGAESQIRLTAHNQRYISPLIGYVMQISADHIKDPVTGVPYYLAKVAMPDDLAADFPDMQITPGMQAEVILTTGERTLLEYFLEPVQRSFTRAFRED